MASTHTPYLLVPNELHTAEDFPQLTLDALQALLDSFITHAANLSKVDYGLIDCFAATLNGGQAPGGVGCQASSPLTWCIPHRVVSSAKSSSRGMARFMTRSNAALTATSMALALGSFREGASFLCYSADGVGCFASATKSRHTRVENLDTHHGLALSVSVVLRRLRWRNYWIVLHRAIGTSAVGGFGRGAPVWHQISKQLLSSHERAVVG